jgi:hypothetical protein
MAAVKYKELEENGQLTVKEIHKVVVHTFTMGDVEDPDLYAAEPMCKWQESEQGKFVMENAVDQPEWHRHLDHTSYGYKYAITAELEAKKLSEFYLRWGKDGSGKIR